ncbi:MAG: NFACT family protein [Clostridia bacterium]|nr:NFACT family protein [Clostridia bacterium]
MAFDGITTRILVNEFNKTLIGSRVEKIYVPSKNELWLLLHTPDRKSVKLLISVDANNCRFHLSNESRNNPEQAPQFCMILRKYLAGGRLTKVTQVGLDRIVKFSFENINDFGDLTTKDLVVELMGKYSNIILVDEEKIIDSIRHVDITMSSVREVLPTRKYVLPTSLGKSNFEDTTIDEFKNTLLKASQESEFEEISLANLISNNYIGFSKSFITSICARNNISTEITKSNLDASVFEKIYNGIKDILNATDISFKLTENKKDYYPILEKTDNETSIFLDEFYSQKENASLLKSAKQNIIRDVNSHISKTSKKLDVVLKTLEEEPNLEKYKQYGELINCNMYRMEIGLENIEVENFYDDNKLVKIPLQKNLTPSRNSALYFKKYNKLKNSLLHSKEYKKIYEDEITYLNSVLFEIDDAETIFELDEIHDELAALGYVKKKVKKGKKKDLPSEPIAYDYNGVRILVGRNNIQNDKLTLKQARKNYTWLHTKNIHGSHVIIETENPTDEVLYYAATLAKKHSKAKDSSKVEVDYTLVKYVHKESGAKPGMVVYTDYQTIIVE